MNEWLIEFPTNGKLVGWKMYDTRLPGVREYSQYPEINIRTGHKINWDTYGKYKWIKAILLTENGIIFIEAKLIR